MNPDQEQGRPSNVLPTSRRQFPASSCRQHLGALSRHDKELPFPLRCRP